MGLDGLIAILATMALQANPSLHAIPDHINSFPIAGERRDFMRPVKSHPEQIGVETTARSAITVDVGSGTVLYAKDAEVPRPMASLTKLMTAMVVLDQGLQSEDTITMEDSDFELIGRRYVDAGESLNREKMFQAMLVGSINEFANAFARTSDRGTESFLAAMREKAKILGLEHAEFHDTSGIDPNNVASASDVARMLRAAVAYPEIREMTVSGRFDLRTQAGRFIRINPTNNLLSSYLNQDPYRIILGKTGSLPEAGYCLGTVTRAPEGQEVITVVLGSTDHFARFQEVKALTQWSFDMYTWPEVSSNK